MKTRFFGIITVTIAMIMAIGGCSKAPPKYPDPDDPEISVQTNLPAVVDNDGGEYALTIKSNTDWSVKCADWVKVSPASGNGDQKVTIKVDANKGEARTTTLTVETVESASETKAGIAFTVEIKQYYFSIDDLFLANSLDGNTFQYPINTNVRDLTITTTASWFTAKQTGEKEFTITLTGEEMPENDYRRAQAVFSSPIMVEEFETEILNANFIAHHESECWIRYYGDQNKENKATFRLTLEGPMFYEGYVSKVLLEGNTDIVNFRDFQEYFNETRTYVIDKSGKPDTFRPGVSEFDENDKLVHNGSQQLFLIFGIIPVTGYNLMEGTVIQVEAERGESIEDTVFKIHVFGRAIAIDTGDEVGLAFYCESVMLYEDESPIEMDITDEFNADSMIAIHYGYNFGNYDSWVLGMTFGDYAFDEEDSIFSTTGTDGGIMIIHIYSEEPGNNYIYSAKYTYGKTWDIPNTYDSTNTILYIHKPNEEYYHNGLVSAGDIEFSRDGEIYTVKIDFWSDRYHVFGTYVGKFNHVNRQNVAPRSDHNNLVERNDNYRYQKEFGRIAR